MLPIDTNPIDAFCWIHAEQPADFMLANYMLFGTGKFVTDIILCKHGIIYASFS